MVFNPGAPWEPVLGTTTPLYALILSGWVKLGFGVITASIAFNLLCEAVSALLIIHLLGRRALASIVAIAAFAAIPDIARIAVGGMEPPLLLALALGAIWCAQTGRATASGTLAALCCLVRPEALFLVIALAWFHHRERAKLVRFAAPIALIGLVAVAILCRVYGQPLPQSVVAKARHSERLGRLSRVSEILAQAFGPTLPMRLFVPIAALGYLRGLLGGSRLRPLFAMAIAMVGAYCLVGTKTWGWYYYIALVTWVIALGLGSESIAERFGALRPLNREGPAPRALVPAMAIVAIALMAYVTGGHPDRITPNVYRPLEQWAKEAKLAERGVRVLASDIGAVGFYSQARILDSEGLVWPEALPYNHDQVKILREYLPEYVVWVVTNVRLGRFLADPEIAGKYRAIQRFNENDDHDLTPNKITPYWEQDYIVYERIDKPN
jgi:hypothetical protein